MARNRKPIPRMLTLVRLLLDVGTDPNAVNEDGNSPLHITAYWMGDESESPLAYLLLKFGADLDQVNLKKRHCWMCGKGSMRDREMVRFFLLLGSLERCPVKSP